MSNFDSLKNKKLFGKYKLNKIIGKGSFGCVFQGTNILDNSKVAIKVERKNSKNNLLQIECNYLSILKGFGIPEIKSFGYHGNYYILIEELLGYNLMQIKKIIKKYTLKEICMIAIQIMDRIEYVHSKNILHRDIKPENFVFGLNNNSTVYIIDFGISHKYRSARKHIKFQMLGRMFGTVRYASYNASRGLEQSRRDDLESIGYMLIYLIAGKLPWQGINFKDAHHARKYIEMLLLKKNISYEVLCKDLPNEFISYIKYCRNLSFEQNPDYEYLRNLFRNILLKNNQINDLKFSWIISKKNYKKKNLNDKNKYINLLKRKESPQTRLFRAIQKSLGKEDRKIEKLSEDKIMVKDNENNNHNHIRDIRDDNTLNTEFEVLENNNIKSEISYNSLFAHYNMDVVRFEDEEKIYKENISRINSIKNRKIDNFKNKIEIDSYNFNNNINLNHPNKVIKKEKINNIFNMSLNLNKNIFEESNNILNNNNFRYKSERLKIKNNLFNIKNNNNELLKINKKRRNLCKSIYTKIISRIKNYFDDLAELNRNILIKKKKNLSYSNKLSKKNYIIQKNNLEKKDKLLYFTEESFTFKNINTKMNEININKGNKQIYNYSNNIVSFDTKKINNNKIVKENENNMDNNNISMNQKYNKFNLKSPIKKEGFNTNTINLNNIKKIIGAQNIIDNNKSINIIINNNLNSFNQNDPTNENKTKKNKDYYKIKINYKNNINNNNILHKNNSNDRIINHIHENNNIKNRKIPKSKKYKKEDLNLIPDINITKPIKKNYFIKNQDNVFAYDNSIKKNKNNVFTYYNSTKNQKVIYDLNLTNLNNKLKNNTINLQNEQKINLLKYKPLQNIQNSILESRNNIVKLNEINSFKNIRSSFPNKVGMYEGKMKVFELNGKSKIKTSPQHYINMNINNKKIFINKKNNINSYLLNEENKYNFQRKNRRLDNVVKVNNSQKIYLPLNQKKIFHQYSPKDIKINNNYALSLEYKNNDINKIINNRRSNSNDTIRRCLNFNCVNEFEFDSFSRLPKNINSMNSSKKRNCIAPRCINTMEI